MLAAPMEHFALQVNVDAKSNTMPVHIDSGKLGGILGYAYSLSFQENINKVSVHICILH